MQGSRAAWQLHNSNAVGICLCQKGFQLPPCLDSSTRSGQDPVRHFRWVFAGQHQVFCTGLAFPVNDEWQLKGLTFMDG